MRCLFLCMFFLSGAAALIYEVAWTKTMVLIVGNTNLAMAMVLAVFLLNFALGSTVASKWGTRPDRLLARYGWVELGIGLFGLAFPWVSQLLDNAYPSFAVFFDPQIMRIVVCLVVLSIPTFLMGATFPLMNGLYIQGRRGISGQAGTVYAVQTLGAAVGAGLAGFVFLRYLGLRNTGHLAAAINLLLCAVAFGLSRKHARAVQEKVMDSGQLSLGEGEAQPLQSYADEARSSVVYAAVFCNAFAALVLEILWTRILVFFLGSLTYAFTVMLVTYLFALAVGAGILGFLGRRFDLRHLSGGVVLFLGGLSCCLCLMTIPVLYEVIQSLKGDPQAYGFGAYLGASFAGALLVIFPGALLLGMFTPLAIGIQIRQRGRSCRESGLVYAVSSMGSCMGALAAAWFVVPELGLKMGVMVSGFMVIASGFLLLVSAQIRPALKLVLFVAELGAIFLLGWIMKGDLGQLGRPLILDSHVFNRPGRESRIELEEAVDGNRRWCYAEGNVCTASVVMDRASHERRLYVDAFNAASTGPAYTYMRMMAHLPVMACHRPDRALVICYGTGTTAGSLSLHPGVERMEVVELSQAVMEMAGQFTRTNRGVGMNKKAGIQVIVGVDGRDHLNLDTQGFDLITLEPMMPYTPGAVHFYTQEFYQLCLDKLVPFGVLCHWVPLNALPAEDFKLLLNTFASTFPGSGYFLFKDSLLLLGFTGEDWHLDLSRIQSLFQEPEVKSDLEAADFYEPLSIAAHYIGDGNDLRKVIDSKEVMGDDLPRIEYVTVTSSRDAYKKIADNLTLLLKCPASLEKRLRAGEAWAGTPEELADKLKRYELSARLLMRGREAEARAAYQALVSGQVNFLAEWNDYYEKAFYLNPDDRRAAARYSHGLVRDALSKIMAGDFARAHALASKAAFVAPEVDEVYMAEAYLNLAAGNYAELEQVVEILRQQPRFTNLTLAFLEELARWKADEKGEQNYAWLLEGKGGLSAEEEKLFRHALDAQKAGEARYAVPSVELVTALLCKGPEGLTESGRRAWSIAGSYDPALLEKARNLLLARLDQESEDFLSVVRGLGFFKDETVRDQLRTLFKSLKGPDRGKVLEALARSGDTGTVLEVLGMRNHSPDLVIKATQIVCDIKITEALGNLIDLLESRESSVRLGAFVALVHLTPNQSNNYFNYDPNASPEARARSVKEWRIWYQNQTGDKK